MINLIGVYYYGLNCHVNRPETNKLVFYNKRLDLETSSTKLRVLGICQFFFRRNPQRSALIISALYVFLNLLYGVGKATMQHGNPYGQ